MLIKTYNGNLISLDSIVSVHIDAKSSPRASAALADGGTALVDAEMMHDDGLSGGWPLLQDGRRINPAFVSEIRNEKGVFTAHSRTGGKLGTVTNVDRLMRDATPASQRTSAPAPSKEQE